MDEAQKLIVEETKQKTVEYLGKMEIPIVLLMVVAMLILCVNYIILGNVALSIVFGIFVLLQVYSLANKIIRRKDKPVEKPSEQQVLGTPPYIS